MALTGRPHNSLGYKDQELLESQLPLREVHSLSTKSHSIRLEDPDTYQITPAMRDTYFKVARDRLTPATAIRTAQQRSLSNIYDSKTFIKQSSMRTSPGLKMFSPIAALANSALKDTETKTEADDSPHRLSIMSQQSGLGPLSMGRSPLTSTTKGSYIMPFESPTSSIIPLETQTHSRQVSQKFFHHSEYDSGLLPFQTPYRSPLSRTIQSKETVLRPAREPVMPSQRVGQLGNPLAAKLGVSQAINPVSYPDECRCRRSPQGTCELAESWKSFIIRRPQDEFLLRNSYSAFLRQPRKEEDVQQIEKDVMRTYPEIDIYYPESPASRKLTSILNAVACRYPTMGYVQGMNFICASLIYHLKEEHLTFGLFAYLVEFLDLQEVYKEGSHR